MTDSSNETAEQLLHLVFGGELTDLTKIEFKDLEKLRHCWHLSQLCRGL